MIRKLHHNAYRCRDSEETRAFYEDFLGLPLVHTIEIGQTKTGRDTHALHTFFRLDDGSHLALEVGPEALQPMLAKGRARGIECRGPSDHGMIESIYFRDPNGYVIELCAKRAGHDTLMDPASNGAREALARWTAGKARTPA